MTDLIGALLPLIGVLILLAIVVGVIKILAVGRKTASKGFPYEKEDSLFSPAERSFLGVLDQAVGEHCRVLGKIRLADVIRVKRGLGAAERQSAFNRIQSKHLDFVVCDPRDLSIQFVIELDDKSHAKAKRQERDDFVNKALAAADVPLFRVPAKRAYSVQELRDQIFQSE